MPDLYEITCPCRLAGDDPDAIHRALARLDALVSTGAEALQGTLFRRDGDLERMTFFVEAEDLEGAEYETRRLIGRVVAELDARFGEGALLPGDVAEAAPDDRTDSLLERIDGIELASLLKAARPRPREERRRLFTPPTLLHPVVRLHGLERGRRACLARIWNGPRPPAKGPWRFEPTNGTGSAGLLLLEGIRYHVDSDQALALVADLCFDLRGLGWAATHLGPRVDEWVEEDREIRTTCVLPSGWTAIALFPIADTLELLHFHGTSSAAHGVSTEDVALQLERWHASNELSVVDCGPSHATVVFHELSRDLVVLAEEAYAIAPDVVDQTYLGPDTDDLELVDELLEHQTADDLAEAIQRDRLLRLWWE